MLVTESSPAAFPQSFSTFLWRASFGLSCLMSWLILPAMGQDPAATPTMKRVPPLTLEQAQSAIETLPGFEIELVASEPLVVDPVAMAFDSRGRLLVIEMIDYSEQDKEHMGRLRRLEDTDQDGKMDRVETMAEGLSWPTALALTHQGTIVVHPPTMTLVKETSPGVFAAEVIAEGFHRNNVQGMANSFRWGLDNRWHLSTSSNGAAMKGRGVEGTLDVKGRDIHLDPLSWRWDSEPGGGQHGMDFNRWGDKFLSSNSDHLQQIVAWDYPSLSNQSHSESFALRRSIAVDGPQADVFRSSPIEEWRTLRTQMRVSGKSPGPIEGGGRAAGYFTGATGVFIYDGDQWGEEDQETAIVADVGGNLVHRKKLTESGIQWSGKRIDDGTELVRSKDLWFRPIQFGDGPDGCLYIVDMCREVIEHPASLPPALKSQLDLTSGRDKGRIWRLRKKDRPIRRELPNMDAADSLALTAFIDHPNGWHRETAARLLYERQDTSVIDALQKIALMSPRPECRLQALATLNGLPLGLSQALLHQSIHDSHPRVREFSIRQLARVAASNQANITQAVLQLPSLKNDPSLHVRMAMAEVGPPSGSIDAALKWLQTLLEGQSSRELRAVAEISCRDRAAHLLQAWALASMTPQDAKMIQGLLYQAIARQGIAQVLPWIEQANPSNQALLLTALSETVDQHATLIKSQDFAVMRPWIEKNILPKAQGWIQNSSEANPQEANALFAMLGMLPVEARESLLQQVLKQPKAMLHMAALRSLIRQDRSCATIALSAASNLDPQVVPSLIREVAKRKETSPLVVAALEDKSVDPKVIPIDVWTMLLQHAPADKKSWIEKQRGPLTTASWDQLSEKYRTAWEKAPNLDQGAALFKKHCSACHKIGDIGTEIGPGLASILSKSNDQLGLAVAEPSREVDPKYQVYQVLTQDSELLVGIMEDATADSVVLRDARGERKTIPRNDIDKITAVGKSLMPDGLLDQMDPVAFNDLIGYLRSSFSKTK